ncbi:hypothetical protein ACFE04_020485 [Oxalis oulophora]
MYSKLPLLEGDDSISRPLRTSDRLRIRPKLRRYYKYSTPTLIRNTKNKNKTKKRVAASQIAKMFPNASGGSDLRRSTRKRRASALLQDYTDSSGPEDADMMKPSSRGKNVIETVSQDELTAPSQKKVIETNRTPRREGLRPRGSQAVGRKKMSMEETKRSHRSPRRVCLYF